MPSPQLAPFIEIRETDGNLHSIHVQHYGRVPDLSQEFSPDVLHEAVNKWRRTSREHRILTEARRLSPEAFRIVEAHLIRERALVIEHKRASRSMRASWSQARGEEPRAENHPQPTQERVAFDGQRGTRSPLQPPNPDVTDSWFDVLTGKDSLPEWTPDYVPETLTQRAQRELEEAKASRPKPSRAERRAMQQALEEREESLRDLVEFTPQPARDTLTQRAMRDTAAAPAREDRNRDKDRSR